MKSVNTVLAERVKVALLVAAMIILSHSQFTWQVASTVSLFMAALLAIYLFLSRPSPTQRELREREYIVNKIEDSIEAGGIKWQIECQPAPYDGLGRICWIHEPLCPECGQAMLDEGVVHPYFKCYGCSDKKELKFDHPDQRRRQAEVVLKTTLKHLKKEYRQASRESSD